MESAAPQSSTANRQSAIGNRQSPTTVLGIAASPRGDGNTDLLLREALRGAAEAGASTELYAIRGHRIVPCSACDRCRTTGRCAVNDDMTEVYDRLLAADRLVFASPIFFVAVSSHAKLLIDRCQCFWNLKHVIRKPLFDPPRPDRRGIFLSVCGSDKPAMFDGARRTLKALFSVLEFRFAGELCFPGVDAKGDILDHPTALAEAYQAGRLLASP
jgi:hypothetical protein